jgi:hypothetical protein
MLEIALIAGGLALGAGVVGFIAYVAYDIYRFDQGVKKFYRKELGEDEQRVNYVKPTVSYSNDTSFNQTNSVSQAQTNLHITEG